MNAKNSIKLGISSCLMGSKVRYDGGHKLDPYLRDTLGQPVGRVEQRIFRVASFSVHSLCISTINALLSAWKSIGDKL
jgi:hypothetical protein